MSNRSASPTVEKSPRVKKSSSSTTSSPNSSRESTPKRQKKTGKESPTCSGRRSSSGHRRNSDRAENSNTGISPVSSGYQHNQYHYDEGGGGGKAPLIRHFQTDSYGIDENEPLRKSMNSAIFHSEVSGLYKYTQHLQHVHVQSSLAVTPRLANRPTLGDGTSGVGENDYEGVPEGLLATEGGGLSASFSVAPTRADDSIPPHITGLDIQTLPGRSPHERSCSIVLGDVLGRVEHLHGHLGSKIIKKNSHQAFIAEFDCLKSQHIDERIKCVRVLPPRAPNVTSYLAANERSIKLFRLRADGVSPVAAINASAHGLVTPRFHKKVVMPTRAFTGPHQFPIQNVSLCADEETFLSVDDFQVFWWHLEAADTMKATMIADIKPPCMDDLNELMTAAAFHPRHGSLFLTATSSGVCRIGDLRDPPCRKTRSFARSFQIEPRHHSTESEHTDILSSIADAKFVKDDFVVTRDYLSLKLWDLRKTTDPVATCVVMDYLSPHISTLYDKDIIFDRFPLAADSASFSILTGMYGNRVALWSPNKSKDTCEYYGIPLEREPKDTTNGGRVENVELIKLSAADDPITPNEYENRVTNVAMTDGAEMFCYSTHDHLYVFESGVGRGGGGGNTKNTSDDEDAAVDSRRGASPSKKRSKRHSEGL